MPRIRQRRRPLCSRRYALLEAVDVAKARSTCTSWQKIGALLGTSAQAAQQRYGAVLEPT
jgi:hypothetical protein